MLIKSGSEKIFVPFFLPYFVAQTKTKKILQMKIDWNLVITLILVGITLKVLDKLFLDSMLEKIGNYEEYEYEEVV